MNRWSIDKENKKKRASFSWKDALGGYESGMKADEGAPSAVSGWCVWCYGEVKAVALISLKRKKSDKSEQNLTKKHRVRFKFQVSSFKIFN